MACSIIRRERPTRASFCKNGSVIHDLLGHDEEVLYAKFDPSGHYVASVSIDKTVKVWYGYGRTFNVSAKIKF